MILLDEAKALEKGTQLYRVTVKNADGTPQRWRVNGKPKTWVRTPRRVEVPVKHGLRSYDYLDETMLSEVSLDAEVIRMAESMIENGDQEVHDFVDTYWTGQQFENVKHMKEFKRQFVAYLEGKY